jgi:hypothetical protein
VWEPPDAIYPSDREGPEKLARRVVKTVCGVLSDELGHARAGARAWSSPAHAYLRQQNPVIPVDRDHDHRWVGEVHYLARNGGRLWAVGEVTDAVAEAVNVRVGDRTVAVSTPLYWSASRIGSADDGLVIDSVSLTASPALVCPNPVRFLEGSLDHRAAADRWRSRLDRPEYELLTRAANARADRKRDGRRDDPLVIAEPTPQVTRLGRNGGWIDEMGERLPNFSHRAADPYERRPPGQWRMRPCQIVRMS